MMASKDSAAEKAVLDYLTKLNRPFSVNDIVSNLLNEYGKASVQNGLDKLVQDGKVQEKVYGKQKVYFVDQSIFKEESQEEMKRMEVQIEELEKLVKDSEVGVREAEAVLKGLSRAVTMEQAIDQHSTLTKESDELELKHKKLSEMTITLDARERNEIRKKRETYVKAWRSRKRRCMDIIETILENYPKDKKVLLEEIGIETDEYVGITVPK